MGIKRTLILQVGLFILSWFVLLFSTTYIGTKLLNFIKMKKTITCFLAISALAVSAQSGKFKTDSTQHFELGELYETCYFSYNDDFKIIEEECVDINDEVSFRANISYSNNGQINDIIREDIDLDTDELTFYERTEYSFDQFGNESVVVESEWADEWIPVTREESVFDLDVLKSDSLFSWDEINEEWFLTEYSSYEYDAEGTLLNRQVTLVEDGEETSLITEFVYLTNGEPDSANTALNLFGSKLIIGQTIFDYPETDSFNITTKLYDFDLEDFLVDSRNSVKNDENGDRLEFKEELLDEESGELFVNERETVTSSETLLFSDFVGNEYFEYDDITFLPVSGTIQEDFDLELGEFDIDEEIFLFYSEATITSLKERVKTESLVSYPSPAQDVLTMELSNFVGEEISVMDMSGVIVLTSEVTSPLMTISVSDLMAGVYTFQVKSANKVATGRFIKN